jgi:hypothetical protein
MRIAIDDFPSLSVSRLRAAGAISPSARIATICFPDSDVSFVVGLSLRRFPNGGNWSFFRCPCGRSCRTLRLYEGSLACHGCLKARGLRNRIEFIPAHNRVAHTAPRLLARLTSPSPAKLYPRPGRKLDRRLRLELALRRSFIVARQYALDEHEKMLKR